jgi:hypothetical protein
MLSIERTGAGSYQVTVTDPDPETGGILIDAAGFSRLLVYDRLVEERQQAKREREPAVIAADPWAVLGVLAAVCVRAGRGRWSPSGVWGICGLSARRARRRAAARCSMSRRMI